VWTVWGVAVRGLDADERAILHRRATRSPTVTHYDGPAVAAADRLTQRGCLYVKRETSDRVVLDITPRGRLALQCDAAARAVLA